MITPGRYELTQGDGDLLLHTTCEGPAARLGHDLTLLVQRWRGTVEVGAEPVDCRLDVTVQLNSLIVRESRGGAKPMSDRDRRDIERNAAKSLRVGEHPELRFLSTGVTGSWTEGEIAGDLTLNGRTQQQVFQVVVLNGQRPPAGREEADCRVRLGAEIRQSRFGIKPYSTMVGALRLADAVLVEVAVWLPAS